MGEAISFASSDMLGDALDGLTGASAAEDAKKEMQYGSSRAKAAYTNAYNTQKEEYAPWKEAGLSSLKSLQDPNFMKDYQGDPGFKFRMNEGMKAINAGAAARGMGNSGATMKALSDYGQNFASNEYSNAYNRNFSRLSSLANFGNAASTNLANAAGNYGNAIAGNELGHANAMASSGIAQSNRMSDLYMQGIKGGVSAMTGMPSMPGGGSPAPNPGAGTGYLGGNYTFNQPTFSDERLKTNVEPIPKEELAEMRKHLKAFKFNYISDEYGKGDWVGVMAQDLEKSKLGKTLVFEDELGRKQLNMNKVMSLFLATMAEA